MTDAGIDQKVSSVEEKFATPKIVKNARTGQAYSVGIGLPREMLTKELGLFSPPLIPHFFQADNFQLIKDGKGAEKDVVLIDRDNVSVLYMHGVFKDGQWMPEDKGLQLKGITIEDIVRDHELSGSPIDVLFVCSNKNNSRVKVIPFQDRYERPKIYMKDKPAHGRVIFDSRTGKVDAHMRVASEDDVEFARWKNWGKVKEVNTD